MGFQLVTSPLQSEALPLDSSYWCGGMRGNLLHDSTLLRYQTTRRRIPQHNNLHVHSREKLKVDTA